MVRTAGVDASHTDNSHTKVHLICTALMRRPAATRPRVRCALDAVANYTRRVSDVNLRGAIGIHLVFTNNTHVQ